ncbi:MAG: hypothetical protein JNL79_10460 [Myxococcales bacterium]|nr:hypothetical protein [Myxococcales bacterium]
MQPQDSSETPREKRVVKRYSNRKLYDTRESRYVTLLQIAEMVRAGEEVQIIDNATKDDLTEVTLAQIIYEEQKQSSGLGRSVPLQTLRDLIHQRGERLMSQLREGPLGRLLPGEHEGGAEGEQAVEADGTYGGTPRAAAAPAAPKADAAAAAAAAAEKKTLLDQSREAIETLQARIDDRVRSALASFSPIQQLQAEVQRLQAKVEELETRLSARDRAADPKGGSGGGGKPPRKD